jgi:hypothetical protein
VDRTAVPQLHHNCTIERWCSDKASMKLAKIAGRQPNLGAPPRGLEPLTRRLEDVSTEYVRILPCHSTLGDQGKR